MEPQLTNRKPPPPAFRTTVNVDERKKDLFPVIHVHSRFLPYYKRWVPSAFRIPVKYPLLRGRCAMPINGSPANSFIERVVCVLRVIGRPW